MSKISVIISQEYRNRVAKKSFLLVTFLMPVLFAAIITVPMLLANIDNEDENKTVAVVDHSGLYNEFFRTHQTDVCTFDVLDGNADTDSLRAAAKNDYRAVVMISDNLADNPSAIAIYSDKQVPGEIRRHIENALENHIEHTTLESYNIPGLEQMIADAKTEISISTYKWGDDGKESTSDSDIATMVGMFATMLIYMFIFISGSQIMSSVVQEKSNRIVEVMICSVKPWELMWGKIISVALVCLTQIALWVVMTGVIMTVVTGMAGIDMSALSRPEAMTSADAGMTAEVLSKIATVDWGFLTVMFIIYFIGGYLLYSSLFAAIGASVDNESDTNQFMMPITIVVLFALYAGIYSAENPDGPLAFWCSMIPFTSPIVMMVRIPFDVPVWELALSLSLLVVTIIGSIWLSAKIYRVGILMYGKKPSWKEMWKWLKY